RLEQTGAHAHAQRRLARRSIANIRQLFVALRPNAWSDESGITVASFTGIQAGVDRVGTSATGICNAEPKQAIDHLPYYLDAIFAVGTGLSDHLPDFHARGRRGLLG